MDRSHQHGRRDRRRRATKSVDLQWVDRQRIERSPRLQSAAGVVHRERAAQFARADDQLLARVRRPVRRPRFARQLARPLVRFSDIAERRKAVRLRLIADQLTSSRNSCSFSAFASRARPCGMRAGSKSRGALLPRLLSCVVRSGAVNVSPMHRSGDPEALMIARPG